MNRYLPKPCSLLTTLALSVTLLLLPAMVDRANAAGRVRTEVIAIAGDVAPGGRGSHFRFGAPALNDAGQVAFFADLTSPSGSLGGDQGLYLYDDRFGLTQIARAGEALLGSTIRVLGFAGVTADLGDERSGLNNRGQVAYRFSLADNRSGIAIATIVPEPGGLLLGVLASGAGLWRRKG